VKTERHLQTQTSELSLLKKESKSDALSYSVHTVAEVSRNGTTYIPPEKAELLVFERYTAKLYKEKGKSIERQKVRQLWIKKLERFGFKDEVEKLRKCHAEFSSVLVCQTGHKFRAIPAYRCFLPFCPDCVSEKCYRNIRTQLPKALHIAAEHPELKCVFMTLTEKSVRERSLKESFKAQKNSFRKLRTYPTYRHISDLIFGGISRLEGTYSKKHRWHPHIHILAFLYDFIPQGSLADAMDRISNSPVVDIRLITNLAEGILEVIKYPFKPADVSKFGKREIKEMLELKGTRLSIPFGKLHGLKAPPIQDDYAEFMEAINNLRQGDNCPICWLPLVKYFNVKKANYLKVLPPPIKSSIVQRC